MKKIMLGLVAAFALSTVPAIAHAEDAPAADAKPAKAGKKAKKSKKAEGEKAPEAAPAK